MNREDLAKIISVKCNISHKDAVALIVAFESTVVDTLAKEDKIVYSNFGTFYTVHYPSKVIYHPKLGAAKKMVMLPTNAMKWMPSGNIKEAIQNGKALENITMHGSLKKGLKKQKHPGEPTSIETNSKVAAGRNKSDEKVKSSLKDKVSEFLFDDPSSEEETLSSHSSLPSIGTQAPSLSNGSLRTHPPESKTETEISFDKSKDLNNLSNQEHAEDEVEIPVALGQSFKKQPQIDLSSSDPIISDEEVEIPVMSSKKIDIYEEKLKDGGKEEATFDGAIKLHEKKSFLSRLFGKKEEEIPVDAEADIKKPDNDHDDKPKVSLVDSGLFNKPVGINIENQQVSSIQKIEPDTSPETKPNIKEDDEQEIEIKIHNSSPKKKEKVFEFHNKYADEQDKDKDKDEINPFDTPNKEISYIDLSSKSIDKKLLQKIPEKLARKYKLAPIEETPHQFVVAMVDPEDIEAKDMIYKYAQKPISAKLATEEDINRVLDQYNSLESELKEAIDIADDDSNETSGQKQALIESASNSAPASRIVASILRRAIRERASDIHIEPSENEVEVRFRIDGVLVRKVVLPKKLQSGAISRIKILSNMKIDEQRLPQDGRFSLKVDDRKVDFRVSTMPIAFGEKVVMRILDKLTGILTIDQLGIRGKALELLEDNLKKTHGMILVTGPTGSGKTTTLYALISKLFNDSVNIITLEDPIEYQVPGINQSQVNAEIDYTFASGLRSIVRQDPDIIMIGEIRDGETADMAIHAALTGHIVLSTLHTNNSAGAAPRLIDMGIEPFLLTSSLNMVIGQRLARKLCDNCKKEVKLEEAKLKDILTEIDRMPTELKNNIDKSNLHFYENGGCGKCANTGYKGRIGLYEILNINDLTKTLILKKESSSRIEEEAIKEGMATMLQDGILKALEGITTVEEVWRVTKE